MKTKETRKVGRGKMHMTGRKELFLFAKNMTVYVENPKESEKTILELISELDKISGHKLNI